MRKTGPTNYQMQQLLTELEPKAFENKLWKRIFKEIKNPKKRIVNIYKINKFARDGETILVPGKVLSVGEMEKKVDVAAINFSVEAKKKIEDAKGKTLTIQELLHSNPQGKKVRILG